MKLSNCLGKVTLEIGTTKTTHGRESRKTITKREKKEIIKKSPYKQLYITTKKNVNNTQQHETK